MIHSGWFRSTFLRLVKFPQIRDWWDLHSWGVPILQKGWILSPIVYFDFKSFKGQNSLSFIRFQCILHDWGIFSDISKFHKMKNGNPTSWGQPIIQNDWIISFPLLYFIFKSFKDPNSSWFIRFQFILHESGVPFSLFWNFHKLKTGGPNFLGVNNSA